MSSSLIHAKNSYKITHMYIPISVCMIVLRKSIVFCVLEQTQNIHPPSNYSLLTPPSNNYTPNKPQNSHTSPNCVESPISIVYIIYLRPNSMLTFHFKFSFSFPPKFSFSLALPSTRSLSSLANSGASRNGFDRR